MAEPYCLAMVLCDATHRDPTTGKFTILGTFDVFTAREFPASLDLGVYFAVTDGQGAYRLCLQLVDASMAPVDASQSGAIEGRLFHFTSEREFSSPLVVVEESVSVEVSIPKEGIYHCELWANDAPLMSRRLAVQRIPGAEYQS